MVIHNKPDLAVCDNWGIISDRISANKDPVVNRYNNQINEGNKPHHESEFSSNVAKIQH